MSCGNDSTFEVFLCFVNYFLPLKCQQIFITDCTYADYCQLFFMILCLRECKMLFFIFLLFNCVEISKSLRKNEGSISRHRKILNLPLLTNTESTSTYGTNFL